ncbi:MAG: hypothetical protein WBM55_11225, partial [Muriicola sp.]
SLVMTWAMIKDKKKMVTSLDKVDEEILIMEKENIAYEEEQEIPLTPPSKEIGGEEEPPA